MVRAPSSLPTTPPVRVLVLDHTAALGGAEIALARLLDALDPEQFTVRTLLFADGPLAERLTGAGHRTDVLPLAAEVAERERGALLSGGRATVRTGTLSAGFVLRLRRVLRDQRPDLVVANSLKAALLGGAASRLAGRPWVWHLHDRLSPDYLPALVVRALRVWAATAPRLVVANSAASAATLGDRTRARAVIAHPGLPAAAFRTRAGPPPAATIGILGRIGATKGQLDFLRAAAAVAGDHPGVRFRVIGTALFADAAYEQQVHDAVGPLGLAGRVEFRGWVPDPTAELDDLAALVHASPVPEPFGQVVVEAMARGVPVIATAAGGVPEILLAEGATVPPGEAVRTPVGQVVRPADPAGLAAAMRFVLEQPQAAEALADAAHASALERFRIEETAARVSRAWTSALP